MENFENHIHPNLNLSKHPVVVHVRCPDCFKQYGVQVSEITESKPRFECLDCKTQFWIAFPEVLEQKEVIGFPVNWLNTPGQRILDESSSAVKMSREVPDVVAPIKESEKDIKDSGPISPEPQGSPSSSTKKEGLRFSVDLDPTVDFQESKKALAEFPCPKCEGLNPGGTKECRHCGVLIEVFKLRLKEGRFTLANPPSRPVVTAWEQVIGDYANTKGHQNFVDLAVRLGQSTYAIGKYKSLLEVYPGDELAEKMIAQLAVLSVHHSLGTEEARKAQKEREPLPAVKKSKVSFSFVIVMLSIVIISLGYFVPNLRNLMGIGVSLLFITLALRYHFKLIR